MRVINKPRGFQAAWILGDYDITVTANGKTKIIQTSLPRGGQTITAVL